MKNTNIMAFLTPKNEVVYLTEGMSIRNGLEKLRAHGYTAVPLLSKEGEYIGIISEGDFLWKIMDDNIVTVKELEDTKVENLLRKDYPKCSVLADFDTLLELVSVQSFVPMVDDRNIMMGIITRRSVINHLKSELDD